MNLILTTKALIHLEGASGVRRRRRRTLALHNPKYHTEYIIYIYAYCAFVCPTNLKDWYGP